MQRSLCLQETESPKAQQVEASAEVVTDCELCAMDSAVYQMDRVCCCVRYLMHETRLEVRRAWLDWKKRKNRTLAERVEKEVSARWQMKKKK
jgi:hypothetical protein